jgi:hypothetical protein
MESVLNVSVSEHEPLSRLSTPGSRSLACSLQVVGSLGEEVRLIRPSPVEPSAGEHAQETRKVVQT